MKTIRLLASTQSTAHRLFFTFGIAVALIAGLLAMHTLSAGDAHVEAAQAVSASNHHDVPAGVAMGNAAVDPGHCAGDCDAPGDMPAHSMLLMVCALALLMAVIVVSAPAVRSPLTMTPGVAALVGDATRALPRPRPPSLLVLSISRT